MPAILQTALPAVIHALAAEELAGKQYDKTRKHKVEKYVDLPDPTLKDPLRMKRRHVLSLAEESRVQAKLDGPADIRIPAMPLLVELCRGRIGPDALCRRGPVAAPGPRAVQTARSG